MSKTVVPGYTDTSKQVVYRQDQSFYLLFSFFFPWGNDNSIKRYYWYIVKTDVVLEDIVSFLYVRNVHTSYG